MSITAVPISMRRVFAPTAARSGKGEESEVMDSKIGPVRAQFLGGNGEVNGLQECVCRRARL